MINPLDSTDRRLLAELTADARVSVTTLASRLGLARATVQARLDRLQKNRVIRKFTIELGEAERAATLRAVMMIELQGNLARRVIATLKQQREVTDLHSTNGAWDLVAHIEVASLQEFDRVLREVREIEGVLNSETSLLLTRV